MKKQQVIVLHGGEYYSAEADFVESLKTRPVVIDRLRPYRDWKSRLQETLGEAYDVLTPRLPNNDNAKYEHWKLWFTRCAEVFDDEVLLIGHSLGGMFLVTYLAQHTVPYTIRALILVAAPYHIDNITRVPEGWRVPEDITRVAKQAKHIHLFQSSDDQVVPSEHAYVYREHLPQATLHMFEDRGHFNQATFPELVSVLQNA